MSKKKQTILFFINKKIIKQLNREKKNSKLMMIYDVMTVLNYKNVIKIFCKIIFL